MALLVAAEGLLAVLGWLVPIETLLRGWLVAFATWSLVPIGSMVLLLIHYLTGGEWGYAAAPVLRPAAAMVPLVALAFVPVLVALPEIYPWAADPSAIPADVARWYLNEPSFLIRAVITLGGWSLLGIVFAAGLGSRLLAGLGLAFFGLTISFVAVDWYLSLEPHYVATAFAAMIAIQQLLAALAVTAVIGTPAIDGKVAGDLGAFLIATLLGVVYLELMTFVVAWYGDLPEKSVWFLERSGFGWISVLITAIVAGAVLPFAMLLITVGSPEPPGLADRRRADLVRHHPARRLAAGAGLRPTSRRDGVCVREHCRSGAGFAHDRIGIAFGAWAITGGAPCRMKYGKPQLAAAAGCRDRHCDRRNRRIPGTLLRYR